MDPSTGKSSELTSSTYHVQLASHHYHPHHPHLQDVLGRQISRNNFSLTGPVSSKPTGTARVQITEILLEMRVPREEKASRRLPAVLAVSQLRRVADRSRR